MKRFALLLLALPLAACATSGDRMAEAGEAKTYCTANHQGPADPAYAHCVNAYLQSHYGWQAVTLRDGSLGVSHWHYAGTPAYF